MRWKEGRQNHTKNRFLVKATVYDFPSDIQSEIEVDEVILLELLEKGRYLIVKVQDTVYHYTGSGKLTGTREAGCCVLLPEAN